MVDRGEVPEPLDYITNFRSAMVFPSDRRPDAVRKFNPSRLAQGRCASRNMT